MGADKVEAIEAEEVEQVDDKALTEVQDNLMDDGMDAVIAIAEKMEAYTKAMDTILNAVIKRAFPGDFVCHAKADDPEDKKRANIGAAAAERIAVFLGIQERNWTQGEKVWSDDRKHFTYSYSAEFGFKNRWVTAIGQAGTRDKFFSFAYGQYKPLEEIREDHIRTAAFRACRKEGVRLLLGIRAIPLKKLIALGYNPADINYANFQDTGKALAAEAKTVSKDTGMAEKTLIVADIKVAEGTSKANGKPWRRLDVKDTDGVKWLMWAGVGSKREAVLRDSFESKAEVKVHFTITKNDKGETYTITRVNDIADA